MRGTQCQFQQAEARPIELRQELAVLKVLVHHYLDTKNMNSVDDVNALTELIERRAWVGGEGGEQPRASESEPAVGSTAPLAGSQRRPLEADGRDD